MIRLNFVVSTLALSLASPALAGWPASRRRALLWRSLLAVSARATGPTPLADRLGELRDEAARLAGVDADALLTIPDDDPHPSPLHALLTHARAHADSDTLRQLLDHLHERLRHHAAPPDPDTWLRLELARFARAAAANRTLLARALAEFTAPSGREQTILHDAIASALRDDGLPRHVAQARAEDAVARIEGALVLARSLDEPAIFGRALQSLPDELLRR